jgi:hypothetical protein
MGSQRTYMHLGLPAGDSVSPSAQQNLRASGAHGSTFSSKVNAVLSTSYADPEFREVLSLVDERNLTNTPEARRQMRLQLQKAVIESNGEIIQEFGQVAEVRTCLQGRPVDIPTSTLYASSCLSGGLWHVGMMK